jgi:hypothetical protein
MTEILILRLIHIVGGTIWVGTGVFNGVFLMPVLSGLGPAAGAVMAGLHARRMFVFLPVVALLTILSGVRLIWLMSGGFSAGYLATASGATYAAAGGLAILTFVAGITISRPQGARIGTIAAELARTQDPAARDALARDLAIVQRRAAMVGTVLTVLLVASAAGMAVARYVG